MSKIPQGEWSAIAARYAKGESITRIAQSYGCTPPAIHYILKRSKQRAAQNLDHRVSGKLDSTMTFPGEPPKSTPPEAPRAVEQRSAENGVKRSVPGEVGPAAEPPSSLARAVNRSLQYLANGASLLPHNELQAEPRHLPPVWTMSFMAAPKPRSRRFARASTPPSKRGRLVSANGFDRPHRI